VIVDLIIDPDNYNLKEKMKKKNDFILFVPKKQYLCTRK
jgi:hypothetical protein